MSDGRASLWLEYYLGRTETPLYDDDGNPLLYESEAMKGKPKYQIKHNRKKESLNLYVWLHPRIRRSVSRTRTPSCSLRRYGLRRNKKCSKTARVTG